MPYVVICSMQAKPGNHRLALSSLKSTRLATVTHYSYHGQFGSHPGQGIIDPSTDLPLLTNLVTIHDLDFEKDFLAPQQPQHDPADQQRA